MVPELPVNNPDLAEALNSSTNGSLSAKKAL